MAQLWQTVVFCLLAWTSGALFSVGWMQWRWGAPGLGEAYYAYSGYYGRSGRRSPSWRRRLRRLTRSGAQIVVRFAVLLVLIFAVVQGSILITTQMQTPHHYH
ncbi:MAG: hypothetical protein WA840_13660 [Caulobacteraceae bacterium]